MPRADDLPNFTVDTHVTPCTHNPLGVKGCGEAGAIGSPAALGLTPYRTPGCPRHRDAGDAGTRLGPSRPTPDCREPRKGETMLKLSNCINRLRWPTQRNCV